MKALKITASILMVLGAIHVSLSAAEAKVSTDTPAPAVASQDTAMSTELDRSLDQKTCIPTPCVLHPDGVHCVCKIP